LVGREGTYSNTSAVLGYLSKHFVCQRVGVGTFVQKELLFITVTQLSCSNVSNYFAFNVCCNTQAGTIQEIPRKCKKIFATEE
jgi:hypothetical protein